MSLALAEVNHTLVAMVGLLTQEEKQMSGRHMLVLLFIFYYLLFLSLFSLNSVVLSCSLELIFASSFAKLKIRVNELT